MKEIHLTYFKHKGQIYIPFEEHVEILETMQGRISKAIDYIEKKNEDIDYNPTLDGSEDDSYNTLPRSLRLFNEDLDKLVEILKGEENESSRL